MKKKLSRIAAMLLAVVMVITGVAFMPKVEAEAADKPAFTLETSTSELRPGDEFTATLYLEAGSNVSMFSIMQTYDPDTLELIKVAKGYDLVMNGWAVIIDDPRQSDFEPGTIAYVIDYGSTITDRLELATLTFRVKDNASGSTQISADFAGAMNGDEVVAPEGNANMDFTTEGPNGVIEDGTFPIVIELEGLAIDQEDFTMARGTSDKLTVTATPEAALAGKTVTWSSTDDSVVKVDQEGNIEAVGIGTATITASVDDFSDSVAITVNSPLTGIELNTQETSIKKGDTAQLEVIYTPAETTDDTTVVWSSSDEDIASVDENGVVTAKQDGTATITAAVGELTAECVVHVREVPLEGIDLDRTAITMNKGEVSEALQVSYNPEDTTDDKTVIWSSSDEDVATVDNGVVTAVGAGNATITATVGEFTAECEVTVVSSLESITLTADRTTDDLEAGDTVNLTVGYNPEDTTDDKAVTWSSSDEDVAIVNDGVVTAVAGGTATITATSAANEDITAICEIRVLKHTTGISLDQSEMSILKGETSEQLTVTFEPADTDDSTEVTWSSDNTDVAVVDDQGYVTGISEGTAVITATAVDGGFTASCTVTVNEIHVEDAVLADDTPSELYVGQEHVLNVVITPENVTDEVTYTYASSDESVATVDESGRISAVQAGNTEITVTVTADEFTKELTFDLEVKEIPLEGIAFKEEVTPLEEGQSAQLEILFNPENTTVDRTVTWASSDESVATIEDGLVTAVKAGTTTISATVGDKEISYELTVTEKKEETKPGTPDDEKPTQGGSTTDDQQNQGTGKPSAGDSQNSGDKVNSQNESGAVQTGDTTNIFGVILTMLISLSVAALVVVFRSRGKRIHK